MPQFITYAAHDAMAACYAQEGDIRRSHHRWLRLGRL
jgi:hypothetical protein